MKKSIIFLLVLLIISGCSNDKVDNKTHLNRNNSQVNKKLDPTKYSSDTKINFKSNGPQIDIFPGKNPIINNFLGYFTTNADGKVLVYHKGEFETQIYAYYPELKKEIKQNIEGQNVELSGNGKFLLYRKGKGIYLYNIQSKKNKLIGYTHLWSSDSGDHFGGMTISYDGSIIIFERDGILYKYDSRQQKPKAVKLFAGFNPSISKKGDLLVYYQGQYYEDCAEIYRQVWLVNLTTMKQRRISKDFYGYQDRAAIKEKSNLIVFNWGNNESIIYNMQTGKSMILPWLKDVSEDGNFVIYGPVGVSYKEYFIGNIKTRESRKLSNSPDEYIPDSIRFINNTEIEYITFKDDETKHEWRCKIWRLALPFYIK